MHFMILPDLVTFPFKYNYTIGVQGRESFAPVQIHNAQTKNNTCVTSPTARYESQLFPDCYLFLKPIETSWYV